MRSFVRPMTVLLGAAVLAAAAACGGGAQATSSSSPSPAASPTGQASASPQASPAASPSTQWRKVLTARVSGAKPSKLNLGTYELGSRVRLGWVLSGPEKPPVQLTFRVFNIEKGTTHGETVSPLVGTGVRRVDKSAVVLGPLWPGDYRLFFTQRFAEGQGPGYDVKLTVSTQGP